MHLFSFTLRLQLKCSSTRCNLIVWSRLCTLRHAGCRAPVTSHGFYLLLLPLWFVLPGGEFRQSEQLVSPPQPRPQPRPRPHNSQGPGRNLPPVSAVCNPQSGPQPQPTHSQHDAPHRKLLLHSILYLDTKLLFQLCLVLVTPAPRALSLLPLLQLRGGQL